MRILCDLQNFYRLILYALGKNSENVFRQPVRLYNSEKAEYIISHYKCIPGEKTVYIWKRGVKNIRFFSLFFGFLLSAVLLLPARAAEEAVRDVGILPDWLLEETEEPGEMLQVIYPSVLRVDCRGGVYLPYGYNEAERYDVAFFFPGTGGCYEDAFTYGYPCFFQNGQREKISIQHLLDRLIEEKVIRPTIVVCLEDMCRDNYYIADMDFQTMFDYVNENYSTYASDPTLTQAEKRKHYAMLGFSQGAIYSESFGMGVHFDDFAYTAAFSYGAYWQVLETVPTSPYEPGLLYACSGMDMDKGAYSTRYNYDIIVKNCGDKLRDGENALRTQAALYDHSYSLAVAALHDCLPMMFPSAKTELMELYYSGYRPQHPE